MLQCNGVAEQRAAHLGSSATFHEALGNLGGLLSFWSEHGWLEWSSREPHQWPRTTNGSRPTKYGKDPGTGEEDLLNCTAYVTR
ncbi:jg8026 [Pararge aegeria aegeria]|uniref:Jg8026 protein n=1 Tax=Pararge aegeria aegeria TaxID=348720 RepID=A0A8S4RIY0_9NEOP|nr:jg8026 [Pararge aegeria aegeria]